MVNGLKKKKDKILKIVKGLGKIIALFSVFFVIKRFLQLEFSWQVFENPIEVFTYIFILSFLIVVNNYINANAWGIYVDYFSKINNNRRTMINVYIKSNIAKYLPGNIFQYASRNVLGSKICVNQKSIVLASITELILISISAIAFCFFISFQDMKRIIIELFPVELVKKNVVILVCLISILLILLLIAGIKNSFIEKMKQFVNKKFLLLIMKVSCAYVVNFLISGLLLSLIFHLILNQETTYRNITSANLLSWLAGYVVPGSSGGIGIRETAFILLLEPLYGNKNVLLAAVIMRICSVLGDMLSYLLEIFKGYFHKRKTNDE